MSAPRDAHGENARERYYSSPCAASDLDPAYNGAMPGDELIKLLNTLLEAERAGARALNDLCLPLAAPTAHEQLRAVSADEGRYCVMLAAHIKRLEAIPSRATGAFYDKLAAVDGVCARLEFLNCGQAWVVRTLSAALPRITDTALHADLAEMLAVHKDNIDACTQLLAQNLA